MFVNSVTYVQNQSFVLNKTWPVTEMNTSTYRMQKDGKLHSFAKSELVIHFWLSSSSTRTCHLILVKIRHKGTAIFQIFSLHFRALAQLLPFHFPNPTAYLEAADVGWIGI